MARARALSDPSAERRSSRSASNVVDALNTRTTLATLDGNRASEFTREGRAMARERMGHVPRPERRRPNLADRRHVPALVVAVHLRLRLPGRLRPSRPPSWCRAAAPTAPTSPTRPTATTSREVAEALTADEWQFAEARRKQGIYAKIGKDDDGDTEWQHPPRRRRLHLPQPPRLRRRARGARSTCTRCRPGEHHSEFKPEVCWQLPLRRIDDEQDDGTVISTLTEFGRDGLGRRRRGLRRGGAPRRPRRSRAPSPVYESLGVELRKMLGKQAVPAGRRVPRRSPAASARSRPSRHPSEVPVDARRSAGGSG